MSYQKWPFLLSIVIAVFVFESTAAPPQKIIGGKSAKEAEFPYQVSLRKKGNHICGGAIISNYHILTAAHCIGRNFFKKLSVYTGSIYKSSGGHSHEVLRATRHPHFSSDSRSYFKYDIAVLTLAEPITFSEHQKPVKLPSKVYEPGTTAVVAGWGDVGHGQDKGSDNLLKIRTKLENISECELIDETEKLKNNHVCTRSYLLANKKKGICQGDSGGPLVVGVGDEREVVGVVSYTLVCGYFTDMYTNVFTFKNFIQKEMTFSPKIIDI